MGVPPTLPQGRDQRPCWSVHLPLGRDGRPARPPRHGVWHIISRRDDVPDPIAEVLGFRL
jgi:hypothetical protein